MNERLYLTAGRQTIEPIEELSRVSLLADIEAEGRVLPAGSRGTVVLVHGSGEAYMIEFDEPFHVIATAECGVVQPLVGESRADLIDSLLVSNRPT